MIFLYWYFALSYVLFEFKVTATVSVAGRYPSIFDKR